MPMLVMPMVLMVLMMLMIMMVLTSMAMRLMASAQGASVVWSRAGEFAYRRPWRSNTDRTEAVPAAG
jgi:hypothetical protein